MCAAVCSSQYREQALTLPTNGSSTGSPCPLAASITLNDGTSMPVLAFGTGTALYGKSAEEQVFQALEVSCARGSA